jgi:hypothetical protein
MKEEDGVNMCSSVLGKTAWTREEMKRGTQGYNKSTGSPEIRARRTKLLMTELTTTGRDVIVPRIYFTLASRGSPGLDDPVRLITQQRQSLLEDHMLLVSPSVNSLIR